MKKAKKKKSKAKDIIINVLAHKLVPKMRILSERERSKLLEKYGIKQFQLPKIYVYDAAAEALNANVGDIIEIERYDLTGKYYFYRLVIE